MDESMRLSHRDDVARELAALGPDPLADDPFMRLSVWAEEAEARWVGAEPLAQEHDAYDDGGHAGALPAGYGERLDVLLDDASLYDAALAIAAADRARALDRAREWSEVSDEFVKRGAPLSPAERTDWVRRVFVSEVAARLSLSQRTAEQLIEESRSLVHRLPATLEALSQGRISYRHAQVIIDQADTLPAEAWTQFEQELLPGAGDIPVALLRRRAVRARERLHPDSIVERTKAAVATRRFALETDRDGMAWLNLKVPAADAIAVHDRTTLLAKALQGPDEPRTLAQLRADVARDLLLHGETTGDDAPKLPKGVRPTVFVTVPVLTLLGRSDEPATLDGYGPIDPETARRLAANAPSFIRLLTHPETGVVLSMGRTKYKVPKDLKRWLQLRDQICRGVGCGRTATHADVDHTVDWGHGGPTDAVNLAVLCEQHHRLKHLSTWKVRQLGGGVLEWTTPTGRIHRTEPAVRMHPAGVPPGGSHIETPSSQSPEKASGERSPGNPSRERSPGNPSGERTVPESTSPPQPPELPPPF